jgi:hypothetical protein
VAPAGPPVKKARTGFVKNEEMIKVRRGGGERGKAAFG